MKIVIKALKIAGIILLVMIALTAILLFRIFTAPMAPKNYTKFMETGGEIETTYMAMGQHQVKYVQTEVSGDWKRFLAYYPADLRDSEKQFPVVVFANGTGVGASRYEALFQHLASWGFIVLGNEDPSTCTGASAEATLVWLLEQNNDPNSIFYQKVDTRHIGISGHSQGGVAVFNAVSEQPHGELYTCAVSLSPTEWTLAMAIGMNYAPDKMSVPTLVLAATENDVITPDGVRGLADIIPAGTVTALRSGMDHGKMLYAADGYVTAWFMWKLQGDQNAAKAFEGQHPEILNNTIYQDVTINLE